MKKGKSFKSLLNEMENLEENQLGKLKGGIAVVNPIGDTNSLSNSGVCTNNGPCDGQDNTNLCFNNKSDCGER